MKKNLIANILLIIVLAGASLFGEENRLKQLLAERAGYNNIQRERILSLYRISEKENLFPEIVYDLIAEGVAKKVSYENVISAAEKKQNETRWIKNFCAESSAAGLKISYEERNAKKLLISFGNGCSFSGVKYFHNLSAEYKNKPDDFLDTVKKVAVLNKNGIPVEYSKKLLSAAYESGKNYNFVKKSLNILENTGGNKASRDLIMQGVKEGRNLYELEEEINSNNIYSRQNKTGSDALKNEEQERIRNQNMGIDSNIGSGYNDVNDNKNYGNGGAGDGTGTGGGAGNDRGHGPK